MTHSSHPGVFPVSNKVRLLGTPHKDIRRTLIFLATNLISDHNNIVIGKSKLYVRTFSNVKSKEKEIIGKEAHALMKLFNAKVPMPNGFIVTTFAFDDFLLYNKYIDPIVTILASVKPFVRKSAVDASNQISELIDKGEVPKDVVEQIHTAYLDIGSGGYPFVNLEISHIINQKFVPVNSSIPKIYDIRGIDDTVQSIKNLWKTLFNPEAIELRTNGYYKGELSAAVVIKRSVMSEISGVIYSVPPTTKEKDRFEVHAYYGIETTKPDINLSSDIYTVERSTAKVIEKKIIPQDTMLVKSSGNSKKATIEVEISKEWQKRQKITDIMLTKIISSFDELEAFFNKPLILKWGIQTGEWFVTDLDEDRGSEDIFQIEASEKASNKKPKITKTLNKSEKPDLDSIESEIRESLDSTSEDTGTLEEEINDSILRASKELEFPDIKKEKRESNAVSWHIENKLEEKLILNITDLSPSSLHSIDKFDGTFLDGTDMILDKKILPEFADSTKQELHEIINSLALDIAVAAQNTQFKPLYYQFSNITGNEYKQLGITDPDVFVGDERFIENPTSLAAEVRALDSVRKNYYKDTITAIIPSVRSTQNLSDIIKIISSQKLIRNSKFKLFVEAAIPSFVFDIPNVSKDLIDGVVINYETFLKLSVYRKQIRDVDHKIVSRTLEPLAKVIRSKNLELGVLIYSNDEIILENIVKLKPDFIIFGNIPTEKDIKLIGSIEHHVY